MKNLTILGSTGSIGTNTLAVVKMHLDKFTVHALVAGQNISMMTKQCLVFRPKWACMANNYAARRLKNKLHQLGIVDINVMSGVKAACELAALDDVDIVMSAIVGTAGLLPTFAALRAGKRVLLANKEALISCGRIFMNTVKQYNACILPVDSEHNAIFQSLPEALQQPLGEKSLNEYGILNLILTGSGGPFINTSLAELATCTHKQACNHPNWAMGRKISIDSATMMNKGLEYIEARWLFNASAKQIEVLLHPQSIIHSMVRYKDGSILAQLGYPDMRTHIAHAMAYPARITTKVRSLDLLQIGTLTFDKPDNKRYPCLQLAIQASESGQAATTILNAANEIAVEAFLQGKINFTDIAALTHLVLDELELAEPNSVEEVLFIDRKARQKAMEKVSYLI